jgi:hypothetical protein
MPETIRFWRCGCGRGNWGAEIGPCGYCGRTFAEGVLTPLSLWGEIVAGIRNFLRRGDGTAKEQA